MPGAVAQQNPALLESLRPLGNAHNVPGSFPALPGKTQREQYCSRWDLHLGVWSDAAVASGANHGFATLSNGTSSTAHQPNLISL